MDALRERTLEDTGAESRHTCASSNSSTMVPVLLSTLIPLPFHSLNTKVSAAHFSMISARPTSIFSCLSAPSVISSMYYLEG